jgi:hypothetical protein
MNQVVEVLKKRQLLTTTAIASAAFMLALPVGATIMPNASAVSDDIAKPAVAQVGCVDDTVGTAAAAVLSTATTRSTGTTGTNTVTHTNTTTQTSSNNSGSTAQVGRNGVAAAVTVGDVLSNNDVLSHNNVPVLSNNDVSVPVLSNNATTVSPTVNLLSNNGHNGLLGIGILGL